MSVYSRPHKPNYYRFANKILNAAYLTGFVTNVNKNIGCFDLQQTINEEHRITIHSKRLPREGMPITAICHVYHADDDAGLKIVMIEGQEANKRSMPTALAWNGMGNKSHGKNRATVLPTHLAKGEQKYTSEISPFNDDGELKPEYAAAVTDEAATDTLPVAEEGQDDQMTESQRRIAVVNAILESTNKINSSLGENANVVIIAGMIASIKIIPKNEHRTHDYILMMLRQTENPDALIPVHLMVSATYPIKVYLRDAKIGYPVKIRGQIRAKPIFSDLVEEESLPNEGDAGENEDELIEQPQANRKTKQEIIGKEMHIRCYELLTPSMELDFLEFPQWWADYAADMHKQRVERRQRLLAAAV